MELSTLNKMMDITVVNMNGGDRDIALLLEIAKKYDLKSVIAHDYYIPYLQEQLSGTDVLVGGISGFPSGANLTDVKVYETQRLVKMNVDEIDTVINISALASEKYDYALDDLKAVVDSAQGTIIKVIIETAFLDDDGIKRASEIVAKSGADFVKTSTGYWGNPTTPHMIHVIKDTIGDTCKIKAAGGIRSLDIMDEMINIGASRFGIGCVSCAQLLYERDIRMGKESEIPKIVKKHGFSIKEKQDY